MREIQLNHGIIRFLTGSFPVSGVDSIIHYRTRQSVWQMTTQRWEADEVKGTYLPTS